MQKLLEEIKMLKEAKNKHEYFCKAHSEKRIKFYCFNQKKFMCSLCLQFQQFGSTLKLKSFCHKKLQESFDCFNQDLQ